MTALLDNFWILLFAKLLIVAVVIPGVSLVIIFAELKLGAHMQSRIGPYFAGGRWGWAQPLADGLKFMQKEDLIPRDADRPVFKIAPMVVLAGTLATFVIVPFSPRLIVQDLDLGVFYEVTIDSAEDQLVLQPDNALISTYDGELDEEGIYFTFGLSWHF